jgi:2,3-bisphosphoglycerate-dependent phosphoglycerate mutase
MKVFIIRHAQSANNLLGETARYDEYMARRDPEPPLTDLGHQQAGLLAEHLISNSHPERKLEETASGYALTKILCSPMLRTLQTAWPISQATGIEPQVWLAIHEQGGCFSGNPRTGDEIINFPGLTRRAMAEQFPGYGLPGEIGDEGWWFSGYEDGDTCKARAVKVAATLREWASDQADERIALISHGTFTDALVRALLGLPPDHPSYYSHYNTAITRLDFLADGFTILRYLNRIQHLPPELISR